MASRRQKISQMTPKGANLQATDLLEISEVSGTGYITKSITGQQIINAGGGGGSQNLQQVTDLGSTTTNSITITSGVNESSTVSGIDIKTENILADTHATLSDTGTLALKTGAEESLLQNTAVTNPSVILEFPNKATGSYTIATTADLTSGYVPYTGATANVDLGTFHFDAAKGTFTHNGATDTLTATHSSGAGIGLLITKGGNNEGLKVNKTSGSGNAATIIGTLEATTIVKTGGTSTQFLMADGSTNTAVVPTTRTLNGFDLSVDRTFTTAAIADSVNKRYVTDANLTVIGNTSGTNTGDETQASILSKLGWVRKIQKGGTVTGTTSETILHTFSFTANEYPSSSILHIESQFIRTGTPVANSIIRVKINTSNTLVGSTQIAQSSIGGNTALFSQFRRKFNIESSLIQGLVGSSSQITDFISSSASPLSATLDTTQNWWLFVTYSPSNTADTAIGNFSEVKNF